MLPDPDTVIFEFPVTGEPDTEKAEGIRRPTLVTVPKFDVLLLKVFQSELDKAPVVEAFAVFIPIEVVPAPVLLDVIGDVPDTPVTPEEELVPAPIKVLISCAVTPDAKEGVPPPLNIPGSAKDVKPLGFALL